MSKSNPSVNRDPVKIFFFIAALALAAVVVFQNVLAPAYTSVITRANYSKNLSKFDQIHKASYLYHQEHGKFPSNLQSLIPAYYTSSHLLYRVSEQGPKWLPPVELRGYHAVIDAYSGFRMAHSSDEKRLVIHETIGWRDDNRVMWAELEIDANGTLEFKPIKTRSSDEFAKRLVEFIGSAKIQFN